MDGISLRMKEQQYSEHARSRGNDITRSSRKENNYRIIAVEAQLAIKGREIIFVQHVSKKVTKETIKRIQQNFNNDKDTNLSELQSVGGNELSDHRSGIIIWKTQG